MSSESKEKKYIRLTAYIKSETNKEKEMIVEQTA